MEQKKFSPRSYQALHTLSSLPQRMLSVPHRENLSEFVLHDLCGPDCFNVRRAAYFVDNADFDCCKGVAGFSRDEVYKPQEVVWKNPDHFTEYMRRAPFNQKVRSVTRPSYRRCAACADDMVNDLAHMVDIQHPGYYTWDLKHDNQGILIFERDPKDDHNLDDYMHGMCLLGFCPIH